MTQLSTDPNSKKALLTAFDQVLKAQAEQQAEERAAARRRAGSARSVMTWVVVFALLFSSAYLWLERPDWLFTSAPRPESAAVREASLRIALANAARHVEHFRRRVGRLPATLEETGTSMSTIEYEPGAANSYVLRGINGSVQLTLRSGDSLPAFVGNSFEIIARRSR